MFKSKLNTIKIKSIFSLKILWRCRICY